ncbi:unnamed protein product [Thlaspi arvense]|uniref:DUF7903 domain-containing protein n=1 Tax=Thlaspi arvense TaxID=13288 RepID=A0AAU9SAP9_THLAR|nr:unnamed protein product [Thlaspi arvense]
MKFKKNLHFSSSSDKCGRIVYSGDSISKWFLTGSDGIEDEIPPYVKLVPLTSDSVECKKGEKPSILMNNNVPKESEEEERSQWLLVAEKVEEDLLLAYERAKTAVEENQHVLRLTASFGKNFFYGRQAGPVAECSRKPSNKVFSTDVPSSYFEHIKSKVVPSHGFCIDSEKERYTVKVSHYSRPNETINCKCTVKEDGRLSMYKASLESFVDLKPVRHLVVDVSCIDKNLDMRLMLTAKRKITDLTEKEISNIKGLLDSATVDPNVKGGLRNKTIRLRVRETDRFKEMTGKGEIKREVTLMLKDINTKLQEQNIDRGCVSGVLRDGLGTLWDFLHCDSYLS